MLLDLAVKCFSCEEKGAVWVISLTQFLPTSSGMQHLTIQIYNCLYEVAMPIKTKMITTPMWPLNEVRQGCLIFVVWWGSPGLGSPNGIADPHETSARAITTHPLLAYYGEACQLDIVQYPRLLRLRMVRSKLNISTFIPGLIAALRQYNVTNLMRF